MDNFKISQTVAMKLGIRRGSQICLLERFVGWNERYPQRTELHYGSREYLAE